MKTAALHVAHVLRKLDPSAWGGTETHVSAITNHLRAFGVTSEVHAPRGPAGGEEAFGPATPVRRFEAYNPFLGSREARERLWQTGGNIISIDHPLRLIRDESIGLVHLHTAGRIGGGVRTATRWTNRPYVVSVHGPLAAEAEFLERETRQRLAKTVDLGKLAGLVLGARRVLDDAARVIVFNEGERRALEPRLGRRVVRMDHGVDLARFSSGKRQRAESKWSNLAGKNVILQVARLSRQKNQLLSVEAFSRAVREGIDAHLVLAGAETDAGYAALVADAARAAGVADRVHILGNVPPAEIPDLLAMASLVIVPSDHEAFGLAVIEGWAAERPVLFSRVAGMQDIAANLADDSVALPPADPEAWTAALVRMFKNPRARAACAGEGAVVARRRYAWPTVAQKLANLYEEVQSAGEPRRKIAQ